MKLPKAGSPIEAEMALHFRASGIQVLREVRFHPDRKWRFDFMVVDTNLFVEIEGITYEGGRHQRKGGFEEDCLKYAEAQLLGYKVLRVTGQMVKSGYAIQAVERLMKWTTTH